MKANELRIGNLVEIPCFNGDGEKIFADLSYAVFTADSTVIRDLENYGDNWAGRPIPLTEEWLVKLGFEKNGDYFDKGEWTILPKRGILYNINNNAKLFPKIKYVHQLQNLYFALTGKELHIV